MSITQEEHFKFYKLTRRLAREDTEPVIMRVGKNTGTCYIYGEQTSGYSTNKRWGPVDSALVLDYSDPDNVKGTWNETLFYVEELSFKQATEEVNEG